MSLWNLRQLAEVRTHWWTIPLLILVGALIAGYVEYSSYEYKLK